MSAVALESPPANGRDHLSAAILKQRSVFTTNLLSTETLAPLALLSLRRRKQSRGGGQLGGRRNGGKTLPLTTGILRRFDGVRPKR